MRKIKNFIHLLEGIFWVVFYRYPAKNLKVIGVTGTDGKTTTSHLIYELLVRAGKKTALSSTIGVVMGSEVIDTGFHVTTASSHLLQKLIRKIVGRRIEYLVLEVTSHSIDQHRIFGCNFYISVFTNLTREHLDYHPSFEDYRETKTRFLERTPISILNELDPSFGFVKNRCRGKVVGYKLYKGKIDNPKLPGKYNLQNLAAVEKVAEVLKIDTKVVNEVAKDFSGVEGRMEEVKNKLGIKIIVDFAHTPNALENVLEEVKGQTKGKVICVFGCAGERDEGKRKIMGKVASQSSDIVIITAEDPRSEDVKEIMKSIALGATEGEKVYEIPERGEAIRFAINDVAKKGDLVIICGKGHEKSMAYGKTEYPWSDVEAVNKALKNEVLTLPSRGILGISQAT